MELSTLPTDPRRWAKNEIEFVVSVCKANGGGKTMLFASVKDGGCVYSPTWSKINKNGDLEVWFYICRVKYLFSFLKQIDVSTGFEE